MIDKKLFGTTKNGVNIYSYTITNDNISATFISFGATITKLVVNSKNGPVDVLLGYDKVSDYENNGGYFGACIGRYGNRIGNAKFNFYNREINLDLNDGPNSLHGGFTGFSHKVWEEVSMSDNFVTFKLFSEDGDQKFPGDLTCFVTYTVKNNSLSIDYFATTSTKTVCNLTNHSYFNLNGLNGKSGNDVDIQIDADFFTPINDTLIPCGEILSVKNTPFDFTSFTNILTKINSDNEQIKKMGGFDVNYCLRKQGFGKAATVKCSNGIQMEVYTDQKGLQFYSGNFITDVFGKDGAKYTKQCALCLETQAFPDAINKAHFGDVIITKEKPYRSTTVYKF